MAEFWIVDRIENDIVILETQDKTHIGVPLSAFSGTAAQGDVVFLSPEGFYQTDAEKTRARKNRLFEMQKKIFGES